MRGIKRPARRPREGQQPYVAGETVTGGRFRCLRCTYEHEAGPGIVNLPVCPRCQHDRWEPA